MQNAEIHPAAKFSTETLREAMLDAFSDYAIPLRLGPADFDAMMRQRGLDVHSSRIAVVDGQVAAIWLTSVRDGRGYLISSGTRPAFRSKGLARLLANDSIGHMRDGGVRSFQTEVLRNNETAIGLYLSLGMAKRRDLDCYRIPASAKLPLGDFGVQLVEWADISGNVETLRNWSPSWQNSDAAIEAISGRVTCLTYRDASGLAAFSVVCPANGTIYQLAVRERRRRKGLAMSMLGEAQNAAFDLDLRLINVDAGGVEFRALMEKAGAEATIGQYELYMDL